MPRVLKIDVTVAFFLASGNTPVVIDRLNRCVIEGQMIGAHSRKTQLVMRGCAVELEMGRCWRVRKTVNSGWVENRRSVASQEEETVHF